MVELALGPFIKVESLESLVAWVQSACFYFGF